MTIGPISSHPMHAIVSKDLMTDLVKFNFFQLQWIESGYRRIPILIKHISHNFDTVLT